VSSRVRRQWRWYSAPGSKRKVVKEEFAALPEYAQAALFEGIRRRCHGESRSGECRKLKTVPGVGTLWEIRVQVGTNPFRAVFFEDSPVHDVCVLAIYKNQQKLPTSDLARATERMKAWKSAGRS
jgi:hypothetical protein